MCLFDSFLTLIDFHGDCMPLPQLSRPFIFKMLINGVWQDAKESTRWTVINPATEDPLIEVPFGGISEAEAAIQAAHKAGPGWATLTAYERGAMLDRIGGLIRQYSDDLAAIMTAESGKPLAEAKGELAASADLFEWFAEEGKRAYGRLIPSRRQGKRVMAMPVPVGVVAAITAWNFPALLLSRKISAALAAGCTLVARPSELTPLTGIALANLIHEAGVPAGVFNIVNGDPAKMGEVLSMHSLVNKISFTGSQRVGKILMGQASSTLKRLSLELGGNAPVLVFGDVDPAKAARTVTAGKFRNNGQTCIAPNRIYVHNDIYEPFLEASKVLTNKMVIGNGAQPGVTLGPMVTQAGLQKVSSLVEDAVKKGAHVVSGAQRPPGLEKGYFYTPTILTNINRSMQVAHDEIFGPVMAVTPFGSLDEALALANDTPYGLAAYVVTDHLETAIRAYEGLSFGIVGINDFVPATAEAPFGGVRQSGQGREGGTEGLEAYMDTKYVSIVLP
jgi:succinate-semialdehyde dehydrogenase / glutarate-semialdehyde dehydrogenase